MGSSFISESETWVSSGNGIREDPDDEISIEGGEEIGWDSDLDESAQMGAENLKKKNKKRNQVLLEGFVEDEDYLMRTKSLTDEDLDELKGCVDLGFGFSYDEIPELCNTLPALELCYSMSQKYMDDHQKSPESSLASDAPADTCSSVSSPIANWKISSPGDHPEDVKARLKFWAQAVACTPYGRRLSMPTRKDGTNEQTARLMSLTYHEEEEECVRFEINHTPNGFDFESLASITPNTQVSFTDLFAYAEVSPMESRGESSFFVVSMSK